MSSVGFNKGQVSLDPRENGLCFKRNETKIHRKSNILLSLSLQVLLFQSDAFILKTMTNFPSILLHRRHVYWSIDMYLNVF